MRTRIEPTRVVLLAMVAGVTAAACREAPPSDSTSPAVRREDGEGVEGRETPRLRVAIGSMISPASTYATYEALMRHVARRLGRRLELVQRRSYQETNALIATHAVDLAFICSGAMAGLFPERQAEVLAVPVVDGTSTYRSYIVVRASDPATSFEDLRDRRFAFTDPLSLSGYFYPLSRLEELGERPSAFFARTLMTGAHDRSIVAVYRGLADAAAVDSLVYDRFVATQARFRGRLRILERSPAFPIPPFVVPAGTEGDLRRRLGRILLHLHEDPEGRTLLRDIGVERFVPGSTTRYGVVLDYVRKARRVLGS